jgi:hypothetical protein
MRHVQGYPGSHWTPTSGDYLLRIAPAATRATANKTTTNKWTNFAGHFDGHGGAPVQNRMHCPMEEVQGFGKRLDAAIGQVLRPIDAIGHAYAGFFEFFHRKLNLLPAGPKNKKLKKSLLQLQ